MGGKGRRVEDLASHVCTCVSGDHSHQHRTISRSVPLSVAWMELPTVWTAVVLLLIVGVLWSQRSRPALPRLPLPPGPPRDPVLGNERQKPASHSWKTYRTWRNTYGTLVLPTCLTIVVVLTLVLSLQAMSSICDTAQRVSWSSTVCVPRLSCWTSARPSTLPVRLRLWRTSLPRPVFRSR